MEECDSSANIIGWWHNDTFETTTDYTDLFAMNVKVLHNGDNALCIRTDKGGTVVEGTIGDIGGTSNTHFNTITVNGQKYTLDNVANDWEDLWASPAVTTSISTAAGAMLTMINTPSRHRPGRRRRH